MTKKLPQCSVESDKVTTQNDLHVNLFGDKMQFKNFAATFLSKHTMSGFNSLAYFKIWSGVRYSYSRKRFVIIISLVEGAPEQFSETVLGFCEIPKEAEITEKVFQKNSTTSRSQDLFFPLFSQTIENKSTLRQTIGDYEITLLLHQVPPQYTEQLTEMLASMKCSILFLNKVQARLLQKVAAGTTH